MSSKKSRRNSQNQAGCMMGIFQILQRRRRRLLPHSQESQPLEAKPVPQFSTNGSPRAPLLPTRETARSSLDSQCKVMMWRLQDLPRWSLDSKQATKTNLESRSYTLMEEIALVDHRPAGVVAKLMGLAELPASNSLPNSPSLRCPADATKLPRHGSAISTGFRKPVEVERKTENEGKRRPHEELRKLERIMETIHAKSIVSREMRGWSESPIVIMKPVVPTRKTSSFTTTARRIRTKDQLSCGLNRSPAMSKGQPQKTFGSHSPVRRVPVANELSISPRALSSPPKKMEAAAAQQKQRQQRERRRDRRDERTSEIRVNKIKADVSVRLSSSQGRKCSELASVFIQREKDLHECIKTEQPSPVSVLDSSFYRDDSPGTSSIRELGSTVKQKPGLENVDRLLQKIWRLNVPKDDNNNDEDDDDDRGDEPKREAVMVETANPNHQYIQEILQASRILRTGSDDQDLTNRSHRCDLAIDPALFFVLEKSKSESIKEKLHRRLIFDAVNEALTKKIESTGSVHGAYIKELCREIDRLDTKRDDSRGTEDLTYVVSKHLAQQSEEWVALGNETAAVVLDVERALFRDLVNDLINGELAMALSLTGRFGWQGRMLQLD